MDTNVQSPHRPSPSVSYTSVISLMEDYFLFPHEYCFLASVLNWTHMRGSQFLLSPHFIFRRKECSSPCIHSLLCERYWNYKMMYSFYSLCTLLNSSEASIFCTWGQAQAVQHNKRIWSTTPCPLCCRNPAPPWLPSLGFLDGTTDGQKIYFYSFSVLSSLLFHCDNLLLIG